MFKVNMALQARIVVKFHATKLAGEPLLVLVHVGYMSIKVACCVALPTQLTFHMWHNIHAMFDTHVVFQLSTCPTLIKA